MDSNRALARTNDQEPCRLQAMVPGAAHVYTDKAGLSSKSSPDQPLPCCHLLDMKPNFCGQKDKLGPPILHSQISLEKLLEMVVKG